MLSISEEGRALRWGRMVEEKRVQNESVEREASPLTKRAVSKGAVEEVEEEEGEDFLFLDLVWEGMLGVEGRDATALSFRFSLNDQHHLSLPIPSLFLHLRMASSSSSSSCRQETFTSLESKLRAHLQQTTSPSTSSSSSPRSFASIVDSVTQFWDEIALDLDTPEGGVKDGVQQVIQRVIKDDALRTAVS